MAANKIYSLAHLTDLHFSFEAPTPFDDLLAVDGASAAALAEFGGFSSVEEMLKAFDICSLGSRDALEQAATKVESEMGAALEVKQPFDCLVTGDLCTWPYDGGLVEQVYGYFSGGFDYDGSGPIGFDRAYADHFLFVLGNHDTHTHKRDEHYAQSSFHAKHDICLGHDVRTARARMGSGDLWFVLFTCRTDYINPRGWLGPPDPRTREPRFVAYVRQVADDARNNRGVLAEKGCTAADYETAVKILVLHHSPLHRREYGGRIGWFHDLVTGLSGRASVRRLADDVGIDLVLFGHTHEPLIYPENVMQGTLYLDAGTTSAATLSDLAAERNVPSPQKIYTFNIYDFHDDRTLVVRPFKMHGDANAFTCEPADAMRFQLGQYRVTRRWL